MMGIFMRAALKGQREGDPAVGQIRVRPQREGSQSSYRDLGGSYNEIEYKRASAGLTVIPEDAKGMTVTEFLKMPEDAGRQVAQQMAQHLFAHLHKVTEQTGNVIDAKGESYKFKHFLDVLESIQIDFEPNGIPRLPTAFLGSAAYEKIQKEKETWGKDPEDQKRLEEIITKKREEFRERETNRRLVG